MLADPRASALVDNFAAQWLFLRNVDAASPDPRVFPDFDEALRRAMRRETELFVHDVLANDRSVTDLLTADYTFLNERLARHYGVAGVYGDQFRRVSIAGTPRRGLLGHASLLTVTSYAHRTSPVLRGKWMLDNLLGAPPPPPPADIPALQETNTKTGKALTMREAMEQHRANPSCAGCHARMDPLGFALENYDAVGRWRTQAANTAIDASGTLPDGTGFDGARGLIEAILRRPDAFATTVTERLMTYAIGRGVEYFDAPAIRTIRRDAAGQDYRFSAIVLGIVKSVPFQMRPVRRRARRRRGRLTAGRQRSYEARPFRPGRAGPKGRPTRTRSRRALTMFISRMSLPRRTFLRGLGATLALPLLDSMVPALSALAATGAKPVRRLGFVYVPNGVIQDQWVPSAVGAGFELSPTLAPLAPVRNKILVLSNLAQKQAESFGDGNGDHARGTASWLNGIHPKRTEGAGIQAGTTIDQIAAERLGRRRGCPPSSSRSRRRSAASAAATTATRASTSTPPRGARRPPPCRWRSIRASCSIGCSATAATPTSGSPRCAETPAFSIRSRRKPRACRNRSARRTAPR